MADKELLELLRRDPERGLAEAVGQYGGYVMKLAYARLHSVCTREDMEEAVSDIFLKFYESGQKSGFDMQSVRGSLSVIGGRHCIDVFRKHCRRQPDVPLEEIMDILPDKQSDAIGQSALAEAIRLLGQPDESIFLRKYFFGQTSAEIAQELDMKPNTVDKRISRGLVKLRKMLKEE